jgi:arginine-tRNA-protein transferase
LKVASVQLSRNLRRVRDQNADLIGEVHTARATSDQYSLFRTYLDHRHSDGGMADMSVLDYSMMIEDSHVNTQVIEYRRRGPDSRINGRGEGPLIGVALTDVLADGLSMVYSFYDPAMADRSLGTWMILDHIERTRRLAQPHLYLGYWVDGSRKMAYKARFLPQERLGMAGWDRVE